MKLKVFEAFSGYGSQSIAIRNIGVDYEVVAISEIDKYAIQAYESIHGKVNNLGDISKIRIEDIPKHDLFTYSFPCQDISLAGKQASLDEGSGTRSSLLWECKKIIESCKPKYLLMENVKNLVGKNHKPNFDKWLCYLESLGYTNYWQVLNSKDYGVPQNRERVFVISILGEHKPYKFPNSIKLDKSIKDILENNVNNKYYINEPFKLLTKQPFDTSNKKNINSIPIITSKIIQFVEVRKYPVDIDKLKFVLKKHKEESKLSTSIISNKLNISKTTVEHWFRSDNSFSIPNKEIWLDLKALLNINTNEFDKAIMEFEIKENKYDSSNRVYHIDGISPTLTCDTETSSKKILIPQLSSNIISLNQENNNPIETNFLIRKLTPREYFRLMGMSENDIDKIQKAKISNSQQYKMAGNSIVINVLEQIFINLFKN